MARAKLFHLKRRSFSTTDVISCLEKYLVIVQCDPDKVVINSVIKFDPIESGLID